MNDEFDRGFHGIPDDAKLRAMNYVELCASLAAAKPGSAEYLVKEREKRRRDSIPSDIATKHDAGNKGIAPKTLVQIAIGTVASALAMLVIYLLRTHLGIPI